MQGEAAQGALQLLTLVRGEGIELGRELARGGGRLGCLCFDARQSVLVLLLRNGTRAEVLVELLDLLLQGIRLRADALHGAVDLLEFLVVLLLCDGARLQLGVDPFEFGLQRPLLRCQLSKDARTLECFEVGVGHLVAEPQAVLRQPGEVIGQFAGLRTQRPFPQHAFAQGLVQAGAVGLDLGELFGLLCGGYTGRLDGLLQRLFLLDERTVLLVQAGDGHLGLVQLALDLLECAKGRALFDPDGVDPLYALLCHLSSLLLRTHGPARSLPAAVLALRRSPSMWSLATAAPRPLSLHRCHRLRFGSASSFHSRR